VKFGLSHEGKNIDKGCFENRVLRRIYRPKRDDVTGGWKNYIMRSFMIRVARHI
jgi:hypothetical protein